MTWLNDPETKAAVVEDDGKRAQAALAAARKEG
jgi:hypothetical protein